MVSMDTYILCYVLLSGYIGWHQMTFALKINFDSSLNETGRYLYDSNTKVCEFCHTLSTESDDMVKLHQSTDCGRQNSRYNDTNKKKPYCKENTGFEVPGCGLLHLSPYQKGWKVFYLNGEEEIWWKKYSVVYHTYYPICMPDFILHIKTFYRCGENRKWNSSLSFECVPKDTPISTPVEPNSASQVDLILGLLFAFLVFIILVILLACFCIKRIWPSMKQKCERRNRDSLHLDICDVLASLPREFGESASQRSENNGTQDTELAYITTSDSLPSLLDPSKRRQVNSDRGVHNECYTTGKRRQRDSERYVKNKCESRTLIGSNKEKECVTILGAFKCSQGSFPEYKVITGCDICSITRLKVAKWERFTIRKESGSHLQRHSRFVQTHFFMYKLESVISSDEGTYSWKVVDDKKLLKTGVFILKVIQEQVRPSPEGCSLSTFDETELEHTITGDGMPVDKGLNAVPSSEPAESETAVSEPAVSLQDIPNESDGISSPNSCCLTLSEAMDDFNLSHIMNQLCYLLDPLDDSPEVLRWPGLARVFLKVQMSRAYIESVKYHKRGNPDNGPTAFILQSLCSEGYKIGHIVWYFSQRGHVYTEVLTLLSDSNCHECIYCSNALKNVSKH